jgi:hypothetical protein
LAPLSKSGGSIELEIQGCCNSDLISPFISLKLIQKSDLWQSLYANASLDK